MNNRWHCKEESASVPEEDVESQRQDPLTRYGRKGWNPRIM